VWICGWTFGSGQPTVKDLVESLREQADWKRDEEVVENGVCLAGFGVKRRIGFCWIAELRAVAPANPDRLY
jgi:hypothetical protein